MARQLDMFDTIPEVIHWTSQTLDSPLQPTFASHNIPGGAWVDSDELRRLLSDAKADTDAYINMITDDDNDTQTHMTTDHDTHVDPQASRASTHAEPHNDSKSPSVNDLVARLESYLDSLPPEAMSPVSPGRLRALTYHVPEFHVPSPPQRYKCRVCMRRFDWVPDLMDHIREKGHQPSHPCRHPGCRKVYTSSSALMYHVRSHNKMASREKEAAAKEREQEAIRAEEKAIAFRASAPVGKTARVWSNVPVDLPLRFFTN